MSSGRQIIFPGTGPIVNRARPAVNNMWDQALTYMAALLDQLADETAAEQGHGDSIERSQVRTVVAKRTAQNRVVRNYFPPTHMPVLFNVNVLKEMEQRWAAIFARTRAHRAREANELELNFFYQNCAPAPRIDAIGNDAIALLLLGRTSGPAAPFFLRPLLVGFLEESVSCPRFHLGQTCGYVAIPRRATRSSPFVSATTWFRGAVALGVA